MPAPKGLRLRKASRVINYIYLVCSAALETAFYNSKQNK